MKMLNTYRAARRNIWRWARRAALFHGEKVQWSGTPNYKGAQERWTHTNLARRAVANYMAHMREKMALVTAQGVNAVLADHWMKFKPRTRCISRMLRELLEPKDRHVLKSA